MTNTFSASNPLLDFHGLPQFDRIRAEHIEPAISHLLGENEVALSTATAPEFPADWLQLSGTLDVAAERLARAWEVVTHLNAAADTPELRAAHAAILGRVTDFQTRRSSDERLYAKYRALSEQESASANARLTAPQQRALALRLRDFRLGGAMLHGAEKERFAAIEEKLADLQQRFANHVLDATDAFALYVSAQELAGVPADVLAAARQEAQNDGHADVYKLTLHAPRYLPVLQYAHNRALRETLYTAYATRASECGPTALDNGPLMSEILALRQEMAQLLGYTCFADISLATKMAADAAEVFAFERGLARRVKPAAEREMAELRAFAAAELGLADLQAWDIAYASEKLKEARYAFNEQQLKEYFTLPNVLDGLFQIVQTLFDVRIRPAKARTWHESVQFFRLERAGRTIGEFFFDPYARAGKRPGAWMDNARQRWLRPDTQQLQTPVAILVCNFAAPVGGESALLTHDNVITLFHEFGHGLHHLLTQVDELAIAGLEGVEWDAVEMPSQFMENFCWQPDVLQSITAHVETGEPLPRALFDKMLAARNFHSAMQLARQIELGLFDMRLHTEAQAAQHVQQTCDEVQREVAVVWPPPFARTPNTFSHIFAGGYSAGYYSYLWAEVLSADAWSAFEEAGPLDAANGARLRREILETGGSRPALTSFTAFRGREPRIDALLHQHGIRA